MYQKRQAFYVFPIAVILMLAALQSKSQDSKKITIKTSADLVSSYIWRGVPCCTDQNGKSVLAPHIQPTLAFDLGGFELGAWGSSDFSGSYKEMDLYASYSVKGVTATFTDYFWDPTWATKSYFSYKNETTGHVLEGSLGYKGEKVPISILVATMFYGADKKSEDPTKNNFSTYIELGYTFKVKDNTFDAIMGMTPTDGFYGDGYGNVTGFGVVNLGLTASKKIQLSEKYSTTLRSSLIFNPQQEKSYLVVGITF